MDYSNFIGQLEEKYRECTKEDSLWKERYRNFQDSYDNKITQVESLKENVDIKQKAILFLNEVSKFYEDSSIRREIEKVIEEVLESIYRQKGKRYKFVKKYVKKQHEIQIYKVETSEAGTEHLIPISNTEGGGRDIVDIIIRMLVLKTFPENQRVLELDEPMKNLDKELRNSFFVFFKKLAENFKIQIIMNTHEDEYIALLDNIVTLERNNQESRVVNEN